MSEFKPIEWPDPTDGIEVHVENRPQSVQIPNSKRTQQVPTFYRQVIVVASHGDGDHARKRRVIAEARLDQSEWDARLDQFLLELAARVAGEERSSHRLVEGLAKISLDLAGRDITKEKLTYTCLHCQKSHRVRLGFFPMRSEFHWVQKNKDPHYLSTLSCISCVKAQADTLREMTSEARKNFGDGEPTAAGLEESLISSERWVNTSRLCHLVGLKRVEGLAVQAEALVEKIKQGRI